ncbi:uncharacterized protein HKW66_Vig0102230 [Vigna angularis]|uniref:Uncharacterized protein n=1 Tax=Phaseolus angularis TaxID=3914 RepID=A0A8T0KNJ2_PHAAN|nr:uncharacterized protein HKW66_Vig0102230 [Vigna angularis]
MEDLDMELDWAQVDILTNVSPSLFNNLTYAPQQLNPPTCSAGTAVATPNQVQNTDHTFNFSDEANSGNLPQLLVDDSYQIPQLPQNSSLAPLPDEIQSTYCVPSMVGLINEGSGSSVQGQNMIPMNYYSQFSLTQNNNLPLMHDLGQQNTNNEMLGKNILANQNFCEINQQSSAYPGFFQQNSVQTLAAGNEATNTHFMTNQRSPVFALNNHAINSHSAWNSQRSLWMQDQGNQYNPLLQNTGFMQHNSSSLNGPTSLSSGFTSPSALNSAIMGFSGTRPTEGPSSQNFNTQMSHISSLLRTHTSVSSLNMLNQSDRSLVSYGPYTSLQQSPSLNLQYPRQGQREPPRRGRPRKHFEPSEASSPYKRRKRGSSTRENVGRSSLSQGNQSAAGVVIEDQNPSNTSSAAETASPFVNAMYDPAFERAGVPIDPLLRLFNASISGAFHNVPGCFWPRLQDLHDLLGDVVALAYSASFSHHLLMVSNESNERQDEPVRSPMMRTREGLMTEREGPTNSVKSGLDLDGEREMKIGKLNHPNHRIAAFFDVCISKKIRSGNLLALESG